MNEQFVGDGLQPVKTAGRTLPNSRAFPQGLAISRTAEISCQLHALQITSSPHLRRAPPG